MTSQIMRCCIRYRQIKKDGSIHQGMAGFAREQHIVQVPLAVISEWELLRCSQNEIYIVENPSVFAVLCGKEKEKNTRRAYMCMNGTAETGRTDGTGASGKVWNQSVLCGRIWIRKVY